MAVAAVEAENRGWLYRFWSGTIETLRLTGRALSHNRAGLVATWILGFIVVVSLVAPYVVKLSPPQCPGSLRRPLSEASPGD